MSWPLLRGVLPLVALALVACSRASADAPREAPASPPPVRGCGGPAEGSSESRYPSILKLDRSLFPPDPGASPSFTGRTLHVAPGGTGAGSQTKPLGSIALALAAAEEGDRVLVAPGEYAEGIDGESAALSILRERIVLQGAPGGAVTVRPRTSAHRYGLGVAGDGVRVVGLRLVGFPAASVVLGHQRGQRDVVLRDVTVETPRDGEWHDGIVVYADNSGGGPPVLTGLRLQNVQVRGASLGISCNAGPCRGWRLHEVVVEGAGQSSSSGADALAIERGDTFLLSRVDVSRVPADGIDIKGRAVVVYDSVVHDVGRNGMKLWDEGDVVNCLVHHTGADASIVLEHATGPYRFLHTVVAHHNRGGPSSYHLTLGYPDRAGDLRIYSSAFVELSGGAYVAAGSRLDIRGSLWSGIDNGQALVLPTAGAKEPRIVHIGDGADVFERFGVGSGNLAPGTAPQFRLARAAGERGFLPGAKSPLIDAGVVAPSAYPACDALGRPRRRGRRPDIGPVEVR